jgi:hypothetical protein
MLMACFGMGALYALSRSEHWGRLEVDCHALVFSARDQQRSLLAAVHARFDGDGSLSFVDLDGLRQGGSADTLPVDENGNAVDIRMDVDQRDTTLQVGELSLHLAPALRLDCAATVFEVTEQGGSSRYVVPELKAALSDVVEHLIMRLDLLGSLELNQCWPEVALGIKFDAESKMIVSLLDYSRIVRRASDCLRARGS